MKTPFIVFFAIILSNSLFAQKVPDADPRIITAFGTEKVEFWIKNFPDSVQYYNFICRNGFHFVKSEFLTESEVDKIAGTVDLQYQLSFVDNNGQLTKFNILLLEKKYWTYSDKPQLFQVKGADLVLKLPSSSYIAEKFNAYRQLILTSN